MVKISGMADFWRPSSIENCIQCPTSRVVLADRPRKWGRSAEWHAVRRRPVYASAASVYTTDPIFNPAGHLAAIKPVQSRKDSTRARWRSHGPYFQGAFIAWGLLIALYCATANRSGPVPQAAPQIPAGRRLSTVRSSTMSFWYRLSSTSKLTRFATFTRR